MVDNEDIFEFREVSCPVCDSDESILLGYRGGEAHQNGQGVKTSIVRCKVCTHQYPNPMPFPKVGIGDLYTNADEYFQNHDLEVKKKNSLGLMTDFEKRLGRKGRFLDVGCGRCELLWAAKQSGWDYEGIDPSQEFVDFGKEHLGIDARVGVLSDAGFKANSFDAIALGGIIEHLYSPSEVLNEIHELLKPNGWLWFDAPNEDGLYMQLGNLYMRVLARDWVIVLAPTFSPFHVQGFNPKSLRIMLENTNFELKDLEINGGVTKQTGNQTMRKKAEYQVATFINWFGNSIGRGTYMNVWAQKK